jgi:ribosomal protein S27AE
MRGDTVSDLVCPKCSGAMELGFVVDHTYSGFAAAEWADGTAEPSIWTGVKMRGKERHPVQTFRCGRCGYLESYAPQQ